MNGLWVALAANAVGIVALAYGSYFRRYHRTDLLLSYIALNAGVLAVTAALSGSSAGMGLGLGLFGILSIIRLRSDAITQEEVAYYFVSLALGLIAGLHPGAVWVAPVLTAALVVLMATADAIGGAMRTVRQTVVLDRAYPDRGQLCLALEALLGGQVRHVVVYELDLVRDTTHVDVRYRLPANRRRQDAFEPQVAPSLRQDTAHLAG